MHGSAFLLFYQPLSSFCFVHLVKLLLCTLGLTVVLYSHAYLILVADATNGVSVEVFKLEEFLTLNATGVSK